MLARVVLDEKGMSIVEAMVSVLIFTFGIIVLMKIFPQASVVIQRHRDDAAGAHVIVVDAGHRELAQPVACKERDRSAAPGQADQIGVGFRDNHRAILHCRPDLLR